MHVRTRNLIDRHSSFGSVAMPAMPLLEVEPEPSIQIRTVEPSSPQAPAPESRKLRDIVVSRLMAAKPVSQLLLDERSLLLGQASSLCGTWDAFLDAAEEEQRLALEQRHQAIRAEGREQHSLYQRLESKFNSANADWNNTVFAKGQAFDAVQLAKYQLEHLGRWASDAESRAAECRVANAKIKAGEAVATEAAAMAERNRAEDELLAAQARLNILATEEIRLRHALDGRAYVDPELGLSVA